MLILLGGDFVKSSNKSYGMFIVSIGLFVIGTMMILKHFSTNLPDFIYGLIYGIGFAFELIGIFAMTQNVSKLRNIKMKLLTKVFQ